MPNNLQAQIVIVGAGVAGLWTLNRLVSLGYNAILIDTRGIGGWQTLHSQGIIHGGAKYALAGALTDAATHISHMTEIWAQCVAGTGEIDLRQVNLLSHHHYLWTRNKFTAGLKSFITSKLLASASAVLKPADYPEVFKHPEFFGSLCACEEIVFDVESLVKTLAAPHRERILLADQGLKFFWEDEKLNYLELGNIKIQADQFILTAGEENQKWLENCPVNFIQMQRRPLHMVYLKAPELPKIYAHCVDSGSKPRVTITTHFAKDGRKVWYLGGELAEQGVKRSAVEQIEFAKLELKTLLPWVNLEQAEWFSFLIHRAEGAIPGQTRPDKPVIKTFGNVQVVWPTKLTFAPLAAREVIKNLENIKWIKASISNLDFLDIKKAPLLEALWNQ